MAPETDPYRILGLARGASLDEIKRAYRQLAKAHHPDAAGERNVARFLAIQAAYERLTEGSDPSNGSSRRPGPPRRPWEADPDRSDATRRAYGGRGRPSTRGRPANGPGRTDRPRRPASPDGATAGTGRADEASGPGSGSTAGEDAPAKAKPGSTSYDGADALPFEPDWGGASWYGTTSGTYWTLNPKEYADPRKHGPEYQARARRAALDRRPGVAGPPTASPDPSEPEASEDATHTTSSWWESTAGPAPTAPDDRMDEPVTPNAGPTQDPGPTPGPRSDAPSTSSEAAQPDLGRATSDIGRALTDERVGGIRLRVGRALIGWLPIAFGLGWLIGEISGCGRFAATCDSGTTPITIVLQVLVLAVLLAVPLLAALTTMASITLLVVSVVAALVLSAGGGQADDARRIALGVILVGAWLIGLATAIVVRVRPRPSPAGPVS